MNRSIFNFSILLFSIFLMPPNSGFSSNKREYVIGGKLQNVKSNTDKFISYSPIFNNQTPFKNGFKIPSSWGMGMEGFIFSQDYYAKKLTLHNETITAYSDSLTQHIIAGEQQLLVRPEIQIFPFFTVYGLAGYMQGNVTPDITAHGIIVQLPFQDTVYELAIDTNVIINMPTKYNGPVYGIGATISYVYRQFFIEVDYNYSEVHPRDMDGTLASHRLSPKIGIIFNSKSSSNSGALWLGSSYFNNLQTLTGKVNVRDIAGDLANFFGEKADYEAQLEPVSRWNMMVGGQWSIKQHFNFVLELGFLGRKKLSLGFLYRF